LIDKRCSKFIHRVEVTRSLYQWRGEASGRESVCFSKAPHFVDEAGLVERDKQWPGGRQLPVLNQLWQELTANGVE